MALYEFRCKTCDERFEVRRPMVEPAAPPLVATTAVADPAMLALPAWRGRPAGDLFTTVAAGPFRYHGILHAPMRADHPAAGVVFNRRMLADLQDRLAPGGVLAVHAWAVGDDIGPILAVARAARCWRSLATGVSPRWGVSR